MKAFLQIMVIFVILDTFMFVANSTVIQLKLLEKPEDTAKTETKNMELQKKKKNIYNIINSATTCPEGQGFDQNGMCVDEF